MSSVHRDHPSDLVFPIILNTTVDWVEGSVRLPRQTIHAIGIGKISNLRTNIANIFPVATGFLRERQ